MLLADYQFVPELVVLITAALPVSELRGAIPLALVLYNMTFAKAFILSLIGNMLPAWLLLVFFESTSVFISRHSPLGARMLNALYARTRRKLARQVKTYGPWALCIFVAIPLPITGVWTGSLAAHIFGLPKKTSFFAMLLGALISALIVTLATTGAVSSFRYYVS